MRTPINKLCFIVTAGYFKARRKFFPRQFHLADIEYVAAQIGPDPNEVRLKAYTKETSARQQRLILRHCVCSAFEVLAKEFAFSEIASMVRVQFRPKPVPLENIELLASKNIALPSYSILAGLVVATINHYQRDLGQIIDARLAETKRYKLDTSVKKRLRSAPMSTKTGVTRSPCSRDHFNLLSHRRSKPI